MRTEVKLGIIVGMLVVGGTIVYFLNQGGKGTKNVADVVPFNPPTSSADGKRTATPTGTRDRTAAPSATPRTPGPAERPPAAVPGERPTTPALARPPVTAPPPVPGGSPAAPPAGSAPSTTTLPPALARSPELGAASRPDETSTSLVPRPGDMPAPRPSTPAEPTPGARPPSPATPAPGTTTPSAGTPSPGVRPAAPATTPPGSREPTTPARPPERPPAAEPTGKKYTVGEGDTLWAIAQEVYGDGNLWPKIRAANPTLTDENRLLVGQELAIPPKDGAARATTPAASTPSDRRPTAGEARPPGRPATDNGSARAGTRPAAAEPAPRVRQHTYVVERGDSLVSIARNILKDGSRWREIYDLNKSRIKNPDHLLVGTELKLPEK